VWLFSNSKQPTTKECKTANPDRPTFWFLRPYIYFAKAAKGLEPQNDLLRFDSVAAFLTLTAFSTLPIHF
jgi:hypothetical protein